MQKKQEVATILTKNLFPGNYLLWELKPAEKIEFIYPGQFITVLVENNPHVFLRRPFSIHDVDYERNTIWILIKMVGEGTRTLGKLKEGDKVNILFPLGKGFTLVENKNALLIGGGYGIAPLYHLAKELKQRNSAVTFLFGARTQQDIILKDKFEQMAPLLMTTEDGSLGVSGWVTHHPELKSVPTAYQYVYTCGPEAMMYAVADWAKSNGLECELSLDQVMGCGIGVCLSCVTKTVRGHETTCIHGPVYNSKDLIW